jgi:hypothetical protein
MTIKELREKWLPILESDKIEPHQVKLFQRDLNMYRTLISNTKTELVIY